MAECLETLAAGLDPRTGAELISAAEAARAAAGAARQPDEEAWVVAAKAALHDALGGAAYAEAVTVGRELSLEGAVELATAPAITTRPAPAPPPGPR
jgi:hypothetical protein